MKVKRTEDESVRTDGGEQKRMFDEEVTEVTLGQRLAEIYSESIATPAKIAWDDWRTKIGLVIILLFTFASAVTWLHQAGFTWLNTVLEAVGSPWVLGRPSSAGAAAGPPNVEPLQSLANPLGTDILGRDLLSGILWATPFMFQMILAGALFSIVMAAAVGTLAGYKGGRTESVLMTASDIAMAIPGLPLVIVLVTLIEPQHPALIGILITINVWAGLARTVHSQVLSLRENSYVEASRTMGISTPEIIRKDIMPNLMPYIMVNFTYSARRVIYDSVALYFLGVLPYSERTNWGVMMQEAYRQMDALTVGDRFYILLIPMLPIVFVSLGLILFAQGTDRLFNPRVRTRHEGETQAEDGDDGDNVQVGV